MPRWVTAIDVLCLLLIALTLRALAGDGMRIFIAGEVRLSLSSWPRLLAWTTGLLILRHLAWRQVPWHARVWHWTRWLVRKEPLRAAWPPFIVSRLMVTAVAYVAVMTIPTSPAPWRMIDNDVLNLFARFDAGWYHAIARLGYSVGPLNPERQNAIAFFPGFPLLIRVAARWLDLDGWIAGVLIVVTAFLLGLVYLYRLALEDLPPDQAKASLLFLAFYPFAVCFSAMLTEALFLLTAAAAFLYFRRTELVKAAPFALFAGLLRPNGFLLAAPLALTAVIPFARGRGWLPGAVPPADGRWRPLVAKLSIATLPVVGMLLYSAYVYSLTGDPFAWAKAQYAWGRRSALLLEVIDQRSALIAAEGWSAYFRSFSLEVLQGGAGIFALLASWPITRRFGLAYGVFVATAVLPSLITIGSVSLGRYTAPLFPIFLWLGAAVPPSHRPYWFAVFAAGQALVAMLFFTGRALY